MVQTSWADRCAACTAQDGSPIWQLDHVELVCLPEGGFRGGNLCGALLPNPTDDMRMSDHDDDSVVLADDLGMEHVDKLVQGKYPVKNLGTLGFEQNA